MVRSKAERWGVRLMYLGYLIVFMNFIAIVMVCLNMLGLTKDDNLDSSQVSNTPGSPIHPDAIGHLPTLQAN